MTKKLWLIAALLTTTLFAVSCQRDAQVASRNLSKAADMFEVQRRVVFVNGITNEYLLSIEGRCSINDQSRQLEVTCKKGPDEFVKHFLGLSDNVTYFAEQLETVDVSVFHNRIIFKPQSIIPELDVRGDMTDLTTNRF
jgi:hypothetical protein